MCSTYRFGRHSVIQNGMEQLQTQLTRGTVLKVQPHFWWYLYCTLCLCFFFPNLVVESDINSFSMILTYLRK